MIVAATIHHLSLARLLQSLSQETAVLAGLGEDMQHLIGDLILGEATSERLIEDGQGLDRLVQHLAEVSGFLRALSDVAPNVEIDAGRALDRLSLTGLAGRLSPAFAPVPADAADAGELEML